LPGDHISIRAAVAGDLPEVRAMVREYVAWIGLDLARRLILALLDEARGLGYTRMHLDTLPMMHDAQALYAALGFDDIAPYYDTPITGTRFMSRKL